MDINQNCLYILVKEIARDKETTKIIHHMTHKEMQELSCYLNCKLVYHLFELISIIAKRANISSIESTSDNTYHISQLFINYHKICLKENLSLVYVLTICKFISMKGGSKILQSVSLTLNSIFERKFNKDAIDQNLRAGATERKLLLEEISKKKQIGKQKTPKKVEPAKKLETSKKPETPLERIPSGPSVDPKDKIISHPLDVDPVTGPHSNIIQPTVAGVSQSAPKVSSPGASLEKNSNPVGVIPLMQRSS